MFPNDRVGLVTQTYISDERPWTDIPGLQLVGPSHSLHGVSEDLKFSNNFSHSGSPCFLRRLLGITGRLGQSTVQQSLSRKLSIHKCSAELLAFLHKEDIGSPAHLYQWVVRQLSVRSHDCDSAYEPAFILSLRRML